MVADANKERNTLTLALVGILLALAPAYSVMDSIRTPFIDFELKLSYGYLIFTCLLGASVYFHAAGFITGTDQKRVNKFSNFFYSMAFISLPTFLATFILAPFLVTIDNNQQARTSIAIVGMVGSLALAVILTKRLNRQQARLIQESLGLETKSHLAKAFSTLKAGFFEEAIMTASRAVEASIVQYAIRIGIVIPKNQPWKPFQWAMDNKSFPTEIRSLIKNVRESRNRVAHELGEVSEAEAQSMVDKAQQVVNYLEVSETKD